MVYLGSALLAYRFSSGNRFSVPGGTVHLCPNFVLLGSVFVYLLPINYRTRLKATVVYSAPAIESHTLNHLLIYSSTLSHYFPCPNSGPYASKPQSYSNQPILSCFPSPTSPFPQRTLIEAKVYAFPVCLPDTGASLCGLHGTPCLLFLGGPWVETFLSIALTPPCCHLVTLIKQDPETNQFLCFSQPSTIPVFGYKTTVCWTALLNIFKVKSGHLNSHCANPEL